MCRCVNVQMCKCEDWSLGGLVVPLGFKHFLPVD